MIDNRQPLPRGRLPKQTEARIPGAITAITQPAGVSTEGQQQPTRVSKRSSEMGGRGIHRNQQIEIADPTGVFREGGRLGDALTTQMRQTLLKPIAVMSDLHGDDINTLRFQTSCELVERLSIQ